MFRLAFVMLVVSALPSGAAAAWHEFGRCLIAEKTSGTGLFANDQTRVTNLENCVKDVRQQPGAFTIQMTLNSGATHVVNATFSSTSRTVEMTLDDAPAMVTGEDIVGFTDCYAVGVERGLQFYCFQGNNIPMPGPSEKAIPQTRPNAWRENG